MFVNSIDWTKHLRKAVEERVIGSCISHKDRTAESRSWRVRSYKNNKPGKTYDVRLWFLSGQARITCTCRAAQNGRGCKHAAWVLSQEMEEFYLPNLSMDLSVDLPEKGR